MTNWWLWTLAGGFVGVLNGLSRWKTVSWLSPRSVTGSLALVLGGMVVRLGLVAGLLAAGLGRGIVPGLLAFAGLWIARWSIVMWFGARPGARGASL